MLQSHTSQLPNFGSNSPTRVACEGELPSLAVSSAKFRIPIDMNGARISTGMATDVEGETNTHFMMLQQVWDRVPGDRGWKKV